METKWNWYWNMTKNWAAHSAEIKWEVVYQNFKERMKAEDEEKLVEAERKEKPLPGDIYECKHLYRDITTCYKTYKSLDYVYCPKCGEKL